MNLILILGIAYAMSVVVVAVAVIKSRKGVEDRLGFHFVDEKVTSQATVEMHPHANFHSKGTRAA